MSATLLGPWDWSAGRSLEGHRTYEIWWLLSVDGNSPPGAIDDPSVLYGTAGLPAIGSTWTAISWINGADDWAFCTPEITVKPHDHLPGEAPSHYLLKNTFTTLPMERCNSTTIENPLNEPHTLSGGWVNKRVQDHQDRDGLPYASSTGEPLIGAETEKDDADWELIVGFNSLNIPLATVNSLRHTLNNAPLWGLAAEKSKFSKYRFTRKLYGTCTYYYQNQMHFSIRDDWAAYLADKGRMELITGGSASDPDDWRVAKDVYGENKPLLRLDTDGKAIVSSSQTPSTITRNPYFTGNHLLLGIPAIL